MKKIFILLFSQLIFLSVIHAQTIHGKVFDQQGEALNGATVSLLKMKDSSLIKFDLTKNGLFEFTPPAIDSFLVSISYVGFETLYSTPINYLGRSIELPHFKLNKSSSVLQGVVVKARKPMVEARADKMILNVEGTINSTGTDALELLRKSPGVAIDKDDQLSLHGKNGVQVFIDGRPSPLSAQDLTNYLKSLSSSQIEAIEIIDNPSSKYEASGTAGIINIRLKKNKAKGFNGSLSAGVSISRNVRTDDGFSINYKTNKLNLFGSYNGAYGKTGMDFNLYRTLKDTSFDQHSKLIFNKVNHSFKTGIDYSINNKNSIGLTVNGSLASPTLENISITPIIDNNTGKIQKVLDAANYNKMRNDNINANLNFLFKDSTGKSLSINGDYGYYALDQDQWQPNTFLDAEGKTVLGQKNYRIKSPTRIDIYALKADWEQKLGKGQLGIGGKFGYVVTDNQYDLFMEIGGVEKPDTAASNSFKYVENVNALYVSYSRSWKGVSIQGGVRAEQTNVDAGLNGWKSYLDFFPSASLTFAPKSDNQLILSYSRRIDRPVYKDLNPFEYRINEYTFHKGSTDLRPQYSNTISLKHTYKFRLNTTLSYSHVDDVFGQIVDTADGTKGFLSNRNLATQNITSLNISYPFQYKAYSLFVNVNGYHSKFKANYGKDRSVDMKVWAANIFLQNSVRFGKGWNAELSGFYTTPSIWQGSMRSSSIWSADIGLQKQVIKGKGTIKASVSDVFNSLKWTASSDFAGQKIYVSGKQESRQFKLSFQYRFGNASNKSNRQNSGGSEEESRRVQSAGLNQ